MSLILSGDSAYPISAAFHNEYYALYDKPVIVSMKDGRHIAGIFADEFFEDEAIMISLPGEEAPAFLKISDIEKMETDDRRKSTGEWICEHK